MQQKAEIPVAPQFSPAEIPIRAEWLDLWHEPILEPALPVIDAHHHLWDRPGQRYLLDELLRDTGSGHDIRATVYVQCRSMLRAEGPVALRPVGETEFANGIAAQCASHLYGSLRACAGIVGYADLAGLGADVQPVLEAHIQAAPLRFRGIRCMTAWHAAPEIAPNSGKARPGLLMDARFRAGFARLAPLGLSYDAWAFHTQLDEVLDLARSFEETTIVLDHAGGPLGIGPYANRRDEVMAEWLASMKKLADCPNVSVKLGGLNMHLGGLDFHQQPRPPSSGQLAEAWRPYIERCIELFGPARCMFESNFSVDKGMGPYAAVWNAFKRLVAGASADEKAMLFAGTATRVYRLDPDLSALR